MIGNFEDPRKTFGKAVSDLALEDERIVLVSADSGKSSGFGDFMKAKPERYFECGIMEQTATGISAGLATCKGDCAAVMDCDLQHPPKTLLEMYRLWEEGFEVIEGVKRDRGKESLAYKAGAKSFYRIMSRSVGMDMTHASDFKLLDRKAIDALLSLPEYHMFFRALSHWVGFKTASVSYDVQAREAGKSKWSARKLTKYAINNIMEFSSVPLQIVTWIGVLGFIVSVIMGIQTLVRYFMGHAAEGFTTVILLLLFLGSIIMIGLGIIGMYIAKIYDEVKRRPRYIITKMK